MRRFAERVTVEPSIGFFNIANFANVSQPPGSLSGWLQDVGGQAVNNSISTVHTNPLIGQTGPESNTFRVGDGTGVFGMVFTAVFRISSFLTRLPVGSWAEPRCI